VPAEGKVHGQCCCSSLPCSLGGPSTLTQEGLPPEDNEADKVLQLKGGVDNDLLLMCNIHGCAAICVVSQQWLF
jgi:hypothetical protein